MKTIDQLEHEIDVLKWQLKMLADNCDPCLSRFVVQNDVNHGEMQRIFDAFDKQEALRVAGSHVDVDQFEEDVKDCLPGREKTIYLYDLVSSMFEDGRWCDLCDILLANIRGSR